MLIIGTFPKLRRQPKARPEVDALSMSAALAFAEAIYVGISARGMHACLCSCLVHGLHTCLVHPFRKQRVANLQARRGLPANIIWNILVGDNALGRAYSQKRPCCDSAVILSGIKGARTGTWRLSALRFTPVFVTETAYAQRLKCSKLRGHAGGRMHVSVARAVSRIIKRGRGWHLVLNPDCAIKHDDAKSSHCCLSFCSEIKQIGNKIKPLKQSNAPRDRSDGNTMVPAVQE